MHKDLSGDQYAKIARALSIEADVADTLAESTATAVAIIEECDRAGIALVTKGGRITTIAPTDDKVERAHDLQHETGEGPCQQSIREQETVYSSDLRIEKRWPKWTERVSDELGVRSILSLQLFVGADTLGSLTLYSDRAEGFGSEDRVSALALASHVAVALIAARSIEGVESALVHRTVIGQAQGMLMNALTITPDRAFAVLVRLSQKRNHKLHVVAADVVARGIRSDLFE